MFPALAKLLQNYNLLLLLVRRWKTRRPSPPMLKACGLIQLLGAGCLIAVVLTHISEAFHWFPWRHWGLPNRVGHYIDFLERRHWSHVISAGIPARCAYKASCLNRPILTADGWVFLIREQCSWLMAARLVRVRIWSKSIGAAKLTPGKGCESATAVASQIRLEGAARTPERRRGIPTIPKRPTLVLRSNSKHPWDSSPALRTVTGVCVCHTIQIDTLYSRAALRHRISSRSCAGTSAKLFSMMRADSG